MLLPGQARSDPPRSDLLPQVPDTCDEMLPPEVLAERRITAGFNRLIETEKQLRQHWATQAGPVIPVRWAVERVVLLLCSGPPGQDDLATSIEEAADTAGLALTCIRIHPLVLSMRSS